MHNGVLNNTDVVHNQPKITSKLKQISIYIALPFVASLMVACGGSNCGESGNSNELLVAMSAPSSYPAGLSTPITAYLTLNNLSNESANNLHYTIPAELNTTGVGITVSNDSNTNPCLSLKAHGSCTFPVTIAPNARPGSFGVIVSSGDAGVLGKAKSLVGLKASNSILLTANVGITNIAPNTSEGADGITFLYNPIVTKNPDGTTKVSITAIVGKNAGGKFDEIRLTTSNGTPLTYEAVSGNSGAELSNLVAGSVVSFVLTIPDGQISSYDFYATVYEDDVQVGETSKKANQIQLLSLGTGILSFSPEITDFTPHESNVTLTYTNTGTGNVSGIVVGSAQAPITIASNSCNGTLTPMASCNVVLHSNAAIGVSGSGSFTTSYTTGGVTKPLVTQYVYQGVEPESGFSLSADNNFVFTANTVNSHDSTVVTLKNTSTNTTESDFTFAFDSNYFTIEAGNSNNSCSISGNKVTTILQANTSCSFIMNYTNPSLTTSATSTITVNYKYHGDRAGTGTNTLTYDTTQATANLSLNELSHNFGTIVANNKESKEYTFTLTNSGPDVATDVEAKIQAIQEPMPKDGSELQAQPSNFTVKSTTCVSPVAANGSCNVVVKFGSSATVKDSDLAKLVIEYKSQTDSSSAVSSINASLSGSVRAVNSANPQIVSVNLSQASGGNGITQNNQFQVEQLKSPIPMLTLVYSNLSSTSDATNFTVESTPAISGYQYLTGDCKNITLTKNRGNTCSMNYRMVADIVGPKDFDITTVNGSWSTVDQGQLTNQTMLWDSNLDTGDNTKIYVSVYTPASVSAILSVTNNGVTPITEVNTESDFYVVFTLSGGYQVGETTYTATAPNGFTTTNNTCQVSSNIPTCSVKFKASDEAIESVNITLAGTPTPTSNPNPLVIKVSKPVELNKWIFVSKSSPDGKMAVNGTYQNWQTIKGGIAGADQICQHDAESTDWLGNMKDKVKGKTWKAMIVDGDKRAQNPNWIDWPLTSETLYIDVKSGLKIGTTTVRKDFNFPLDNNWGSGPNYDWDDFGGSLWTWTGLNKNWTSNIPNSCNKWTVDSPGYGRYGVSIDHGIQVESSEVISQGELLCNSYSLDTVFTVRLICVSQ